VSRARRTAALVTALVLLAGCGDDDTADQQAAPSGGEGVVTVVAEDVAFGAATYEADAGTVEVEYVNEGVIQHSLLIEGVDDFRLAVDSRGDTDRGSVELEPGSYVLICDIPGHEQAGMVADLEVR
jgi:plastocyanin